MSTGVVPARIRGRIGQGDEPSDPKIHGKWFAEVTIWDISGTKELASPFTFGPWETKDEAEHHLKDLCEITAEFVTEILTGAVPTEMVNMKTGEHTPYESKRKET